MSRLKVLVSGGALALVLTVPFAGVASAQEDDSSRVAVTEDIDALYVGGVSETRSVTPAEVRGVAVTPPQAIRAQELPVTGGDILGLVLLGGAAIGTGALLVRRGHRTS